MQITKLRCCILAMLLAVSPELGMVGPAYAYSVYRGVTADARNIVVWHAANFGVSGAPPALAFFHFPDDNAARAGLSAARCLVKVDFGALVAPMIGTQLPIGNAGIPVNANHSDNPSAFPWNMTFDDNPPGHWSIAKTAIQNPPSTNNAASRVAAAGFQSLATTGGTGVAVVNGQLRNCRAQ